MGRGRRGGGRRRGSIGSKKKRTGGIGARKIGGGGIGRRRGGGGGVIIISGENGGAIIVRIVFVLFFFVVPILMWVLGLPPQATFPLVGVGCFFFVINVISLRRQQQQARLLAAADANAQPGIDAVVINVGDGTGADNEPAPAVIPTTANVIG